MLMRLGSFQVRSALFLIIVFVWLGQTVMSQKRAQPKRSTEQAEFSKLLDIMMADMEAGWNTVVHSSTFIFKYNPSRVSGSSTDVVKVWIKKYLKGPFSENRKLIIRETERSGQKAIGYESYAYSLILFDLDCSSSTLRISSSIDYDMKGTVLNSTTLPDSERSPLSPESVGEAIFAKFCTAGSVNSSAWRMAASSDDMNIFYDSSSLFTTETGTVKLWEKWILKSDTAGGAQSIKDNIKYLAERIPAEQARRYGYDLILSEYDCKKRILRQLRWMICSSEGERLYEFADVATDWSPPDADGPADRALTVVCKASRER